MAPRIYWRTRTAIVEGHTVFVRLPSLRVVHSASRLLGFAGGYKTWRPMTSSTSLNCRRLLNAFLENRFASNLQPGKVAVLKMSDYVRVTLTMEAKKKAVRQIDGQTARDSDFR